MSMDIKINVKAKRKNKNAKRGRQNKKRFTNSTGGYMGGGSAIIIYL